MARQLILGTLIVLATSTAAFANGRPPATSTINFRQGDEQHIAAGLTFGLVISHDGGASWHWMCEDAIGYGGTWDPDYAYASSGALFATTFGGALVNRDGCSFEETVHGDKFISSLTLAPDGALYVAAVVPADPSAVPPQLGDAAIYKSTDDGVTFPTSSMPGMVGDWWNSLEVAPANAQRMYLSGYRLISGNRTFLLFKSDDAGASWSPMALTGLTTTRNSSIDIVGISKLDADKVYVRVSYQNENAVSDGLFRSVDGGATWTQILTKQDEIAFVVRANGDLVAGTRSSGVFTSTAASNGDAWTELTGAPHLNCLVENSAGEVWGCTQNFGANQVPSDDAGIMKTTDLVTWTPVLRYQDIAGPVDCAAGTLQRSECVEKVFAGRTSWCLVRAQFAIVADPTGCDVPSSEVVVNPPPKGCCESSAGGSPAGLAIGAFVGIMLLRRRRRA